MNDWAIMLIVLVVGYLMGRISAKPVVIDPYRQTTGAIEDPGEVYEGRDEWEETMNRKEE